MKKLFVFLAFAGMFMACTNKATKSVETADTVSVDTVVVDSVVVDSVVVDSIA